MSKADADNAGVAADQRSLYFRIDNGKVNMQPPAEKAMGHRSLMHGDAHSQCGAKTRAGTACQSPPVAGRKRCRLHGGLSPGAPRGSRNGNYRRGDWTTEAIEERRWLRSLVQALRKQETGR